MFLKNISGNIQSGIDNPYLDSLSILVWVMPVSIVLFAIGLHDFGVLPQPFLVLAALLTIGLASGGWLFWHQASKVSILATLPLISPRRK